MSIVPASVKVAGRVALNLALGCLAAFVLLQGLTGQFAYYGLLAIPVLGLWVIVGAVIPLLRFDPRIGRAYLLGNLGTLGAAVVLVLVLLIMSPQTPSKTILAPSLLLGLVLGIAAGALLPRERRTG